MKFRRIKIRRFFKETNDIAVGHFFPDKKNKKKYMQMYTLKEIEKITD